MKLSNFRSNCFSLQIKGPPTPSENERESDIKDYTDLPNRFWTHRSEREKEIAWKDCMDLIKLVNSHQMKT